MAKLEVGQVVLVTDGDWTEDAHDRYEDGDLLEINSDEGHFFVAYNLRTGATDCRIEAEEVTLMNKVQVLVTHREVGDAYSVGNYQTVYRKVGEANGYVDYGSWGAKRIQSWKFRVTAQLDKPVVVDPVGKEIAFGDILVGDRIRRHVVDRDGNEVTSVGTVAVLDRIFARAKGGVIVARSSRPVVYVSDVSVLLERVAVNEFAEARVGSVAVGEKFIFLKIGTDSWRAIRKDGMDVKEYTYTDKAFLGSLLGTKLTFSAPDGFPLAG